MISKKDLELIDFILRKATGRTHMKFGGKMILMFGDLFQLTPVNHKKNGFVF